MLWTFSKGYVWIIFIAIKSQTAAQNDGIDVCDNDRIYLRNDGDTAKIVFYGPRKVEDNPCVLRIQASSSNYISIKPKNNFIFYDCHIKYNPPTCTPGCSYAYLFDGFYYNKTLKYISNSTWGSFNTTSSLLYVAVCHTGMSYINMELALTTVPRRYEISGDSENKRSGYITSAHFPDNYIQNGEQSTFIFTSKKSTDRVVLLFDDYDIAPEGSIYFTNSRDHSAPIFITDENAYRPVVQSSGNSLRLTFDNGWAPIQQHRQYLGFKASYMFIGGSEIYIKPSTVCGSYYMTLDGGHIEQRSTSYNMLYDCVWVVKTQPGYTGTYMKLDRFTKGYGSNTPEAEVNVEIRAGLTSNGTLLDTLYPIREEVYRGYDHKDGLYIRLRGILRTSVFKISFTSYTNYFSYGCDPVRMFRCSSNQCIPRRLACDHVEHCKDGSDETYGCSGSDIQDDSPHNLTVSVVIPIVVSVFLIIILCILFVLVRKCRQAREFHSMRSSDPVVCTTDRRRRRRCDQFRRPPDAPPSYDEALVTGIPVPDNGYPDDDYGVPKPPSYNEATSTPLFEDIGEPSPPYESHNFEEQRNSASDHDVNEHEGSSNNVSPVISNSNAGDFLITDGQNAVSTYTQTDRQHRQRNRFKNNKWKDQPKIHLNNTGQLPSMPSLSSAVSTQSMINISNVQQDTQLSRARSEQILSPQGLVLGIDNPTFQNDRGETSNTLTRLCNGKASSNIDLPATNNTSLQQNVHHHPNGYRLHPESEHQHAETSTETHHSYRRPQNQKHYTSKKLERKLSAKERLKPADPKLNKKYTEELMKRENSRRKNKSGVNDTKNKYIDRPQSEVQQSCYNRGTEENLLRRRPDTNTNACGYHRSDRQGHTNTLCTTNEEEQPSKSNHAISSVPENNPRFKSVKNDHHQMKNSSSYDDERNCRKINKSQNNKNGKRYRDDLPHGSEYKNNILSGSTQSLNLSAGHRSKLGRSTMSLNENLIRETAYSCEDRTIDRDNGNVRRGAGHSEHALSCVNLGDVGDICV